jgi:hypothetical protein
MIMGRRAGFRGGTAPSRHDHAAVKMTATGRRPYHRGMYKADDARADLVVLVKRRAVDLCRVAACLCQNS